jgi:hypothetical protein
MGNRSDNFNRADSSSSLGTPSDGGSDWVVRPGSPTTIFGIASNQARRFSTQSVTGGELAWLESGVQNVQVEATFSTVAGEMGLIARLTDENNFIRLRITVSLVQISKFEAGVGTLLGGVSATVSNGDVVMLQCDGDELTPFINEAPVFGAVSSSFNNTATKHGLRADGATVTGRWDDFSITNLDSDPQLLLPVSDISSGSVWFASAGSPAELWQMLDGEKSPDTDYCYTNSAGTMEVKFASGSTPSLQSGHTLRYRLRGNGTCDALVKLKVGSTVLAQWTETNVPAVDTDYEHTLDSSPSFTISDYSDLRISVEAVP